MPPPNMPSNEKPTTMKVNDNPAEASLKGKLNGATNPALTATPEVSDGPRLNEQGTYLPARYETLGNTTSSKIYREDR